MKTGMKQTIIGDIPVDWEVKKLEDISDFITKGSTPTTYGYDWVKEGVVFLRSECVGMYGFTLSGAMYISDDAHRTMNRSIIKSGDILITITGNVGRVCVLPQSIREANINQHIARVRINNNDVNSQFVYQFLGQENIIKEYSKITTGQAYPQLSLKQVREIYIPLPPLAEQQKIAEILSTVDEKMAVIDEQLAQTQELKKGMMQRLLTRGIGHTAFKDSPLGEIPERWAATEVQHVLNIHNTLRKPLSAEVRKTIKGEYRYYGPTGILDYINEFLLEGKYVLIGEDGDHFLKYEVKRMTQLVEGKFNVNNHAHILSGGEECLTEWFHLYYQHRSLDASLTRQGAGRYKLTKAALLRLPIALPPIDEQKLIVGVFACIEDKLQVLNDKKAQYQELKRGLMQQLLTGKRRVKVLQEETLLA